MRLTADSWSPQGEALHELDIALDLTRATGTSQKERLRSVEP